MPRNKLRLLLPAVLLEHGRTQPLKSLLAVAFRWVDEKVRGFYSAVGLFLAAGLGLSLLALLGFAELAESVMEGETRKLDEGVLLWMDQHATGTLDHLAVEITALGDGTVVVVIAVVASLLLWLTRNRDLAVTLWVATLGGLLLNVVLKLAFDRPRPQLFEWRTEQVALPSFPSGHATGAMVVYLALAYAITRLEPTRALRRLTFTVFGILVLLIGLSRLYLGVHFPSDVIAGYCVGFAWATFSAVGVQAIRLSRERRGARTT